MPATLTTIDSLMRGVVGPSVASGDGSPVPVRLGRNGELIIGNGHGKYYEQVARGKCYHASMQAGASMGTALTATAVTLTLYNPVNSGMLLSLIHDLYPSRKALDDAIASGSTSGADEQFEQLDQLLVALGASVGPS
jgi:hypothetical protein